MAQARTDVHALEQLTLSEYRIVDLLHVGLRCSVVSAFFKAPLIFVYLLCQGGCVFASACSSFGLFVLYCPQFWKNNPNLFYFFLLASTDEIWGLMGQKSKPKSYWLILDELSNDSLSLKTQIIYTTFVWCQD